MSDKAKFKAVDDLVSRTFDAVGDNWTEAFREVNSADTPSDATFQLGGPSGLPDKEVSDHVAPEVMEKMTYSVDVTLNGTPLRHRLVSDKPIKTIKLPDITMPVNRQYMELETKSVSILLHDGGEHRPQWFHKPSRIVIGCAVETDILTGELIFNYD
jgi:hypothetical protein